MGYLVVVGGSGLSETCSKNLRLSRLSTSKLTNSGVSGSSKDRVALEVCRGRESSGFSSQSTL